MQACATLSHRCISIATNCHSKCGSWQRKLLAGPHAASTSHATTGHCAESAACNDSIKKASFVLDVLDALHSLQGNSRAFWLSNRMVQLACRSQKWRIPRTQRCWGTTLSDIGLLWWRLVVSEWMPWHWVQRCAQFVSWSFMAFHAMSRRFHPGPLQPDSASGKALGKSLQRAPEDAESGLLLGGLACLCFNLFQHVSTIHSDSAPCVRAVYTVDTC